MSKSGDRHPSIGGLDFEALNRQDVVKLEEPFTKEEVFNALSALNGDKLQGPTGFQWRFGSIARMS